MGTMKLQEWIGEFCQMHDRAHRGALTDDQRAEYLAARDELARALLRAQRVSLLAGQSPRRNLRAALALPMVLQLPSGRIPTLTRDISSGGFAATLSTSPGLGVQVPFVLQTARAAPPIVGKARLVALNLEGSSPRAGFAFDELSAEGAERIELLVFDAVVARLQEPV